MGFKEKNCVRETFLGCLTILNLTLCALIASSIAGIIFLF
jgi:hypothetical protein